MTEEASKENGQENSSGNGNQLEQKVAEFEQIVAEKEKRNCRSEKVGRRAERETVSCQ